MELWVTDIQEIKGEFEVYDITVDIDECFIVEGCILHNCPFCQPLDQEIFPINKGLRPPLHVNCRCTTMPVVKSFKELGFDIDEATASTRASMNGQVPDKLTYNEWLKKQPDSVQNDILGPNRAKMFRGGADVKDFVDVKNMEKFTLKELEKMDIG